MATEGIAEGHVIQVAGPTIEMQFPEGHVPKLLNAIHVTSEGYDVPVTINITAEVAQHIGEGRVRTIAMEPTDGLVRGMKAYDLGGPITIPVGNQTLGRMLNVLGEPIDNMGPVETDQHAPIHRAAPAFDEQATGLEMFETGIKVIDLIQPYLHGGKIGLFGGAGVGKTVIDHGTDQQHRHEARRRFGVCRRGRADARRQRSLDGNAGDRRQLSIRRTGRKSKVALVYGQMTEPPGARLRVAFYRTDSRRIFPRSGRAGRAALHRQHFPLYSGGFGSIGAAGTHAVGGGISAESGD